MMDALPAEWLCELEMEEDPSSFIDQCGGVITSISNYSFEDDDQYGFQSAVSPESFPSSLNAMTSTIISTTIPTEKLRDYCRPGTSTTTTTSTTTSNESSSPSSYLVSSYDQSSDTIPTNHHMQMQLGHVTTTDHDRDHDQGDKYFCNKKPTTMMNDVTGAAGAGGGGTSNNYSSPAADQQHYYTTTVTHDSPPVLELQDSCDKKMLSSSSTTTTTTESAERVEGIHSLSLSRPPLQAKNHVVAERKRRERLNQKLIALSALIPGLKKMDKASILGDATKYIKQLQERVKTLEAKQQQGGEGKATKLGSSNSKTRLISLGNKRSRVLVSSNGNSDHDDDDNKDEDGDDDEDDGDDHDDDTSTTCSNDHNDNNSSRANRHLAPQPQHHQPDHDQEIDLRVSDKHVLLRINSKKQDGVVVAKILREFDKFCLHVSSSSVLPFGDTILEITIIAKMGDEFSMKVKDLVKNLRSAILKLI